MKTVKGRYYRNHCTGSEEAEDRTGGLSGNCCPRSEKTEESGTIFFEKGETENEHIQTDARNRGNKWRKKNGNIASGDALERRSLSPGQRELSLTNLAGN